MQTLAHLLQWQPRSEALAPAGLLAHGRSAARLLSQLRKSHQPERFQVQVWRGQLWLQGPDLPWADGVCYCAPVPEAALLWLPTTQQTSLPPDLLLPALQRHAAGRSPLLLLPQPLQLLPLDAVRPLYPLLFDWLDAQLSP